MNRRILFCLGFLLVFCILLVGCAAEDAIHQAEVSIELAQGVHADYLAPYEFHSAEQFLAEAKKQLNESDYSAAQEYADHARQMAQESAAIARKKHSSPMIPWTPPEGQEPEEFEEAAPPAQPDEQGGEQ